MFLTRSLLFVPQVIHEYGEPRRNDTERGKFRPVIYFSLMSGLICVANDISFVITAVSGQYIVTCYIILLSRGTSVGIVSDCGLDCWVIGARFPAEAADFS
jgi:hypothetical protein